MMYTHFCSVEGKLQRRQMKSHPRLCLGNEHNIQGKSSKLAIKSWIMPRLNPGEAMILSNKIYIFR